MTFPHASCTKFYVCMYVCMYVYVYVYIYIYSPFIILMYHWSRAVKIYCFFKREKQKRKSKPFAFGKGLGRKCETTEENKCLAVCFPLPDVLFSLQPQGLILTMVSPPISLTRLRIQLNKIVFGCFTHCTNFEDKQGVEHLCCTC